MPGMKIAEIVPVSCLELTADNYYHMCLAHLVLEDYRYSSFFKRMSKEGKYVIMDNGAAEGKNLSDKELLKAYEEISPSEIILPDILKDGERTLFRSLNFYEDNRKYIENYNIMIVPQGKDRTEWLEYKDKMLDEIPANCIGVPKWLGSGKRFSRISIMESMWRCHIPIHLLGCSEGPSIINECYRANAKVRSCDSAFAYICAKTGVDHIGRFTTRPSGEIRFLNDPKMDNLEKLMEEFENEAGVINNKEA